MEAAEKFSTELGTAPACRAFGVSRASLYRRRQRAAAPAAERPRPRSHRALSGADRQDVLDLLHSGRFVDQVPAQVCAALLDADRYLCSVRTMYRILDANQEVRERRNQRRHPVYQKPELLATGPNEVWTWDITKLKGPRKWTYFYLYVILDIFSRQAVGWMVADCESATLAKKLIRESCDKQRISRDQLILHADRGSSMKSKAVALLLSDLGVTQSHSRPYVSDDNPFSEAQFKTLKYRPDFPERFGSIQDAKAFCRDFFHWYNNVHYHSGLNWLTPAMVHSGQTGPVLERRQQRCWMHKTMNVLNCLPKSAQAKAKQALHAIWKAETKADAEKAFDLFIETYEPKYPKATLCLQKDREELLAFYDFPAKHWQSLRTTNPIESTFATIRHRTKRSRGCLTRDGMLHMMFKLGQCAQKNWRRLRGFDDLAKVITGVKFNDGIEVTNVDQAAA